MNRSLRYFFFVFMLLSLVSKAQNEGAAVVYSLKDVIDLAQGQSPQMKLAKNAYTSRYWQYKLFRSNYLPQLSLNGTLPNLDKSIRRITLDDGADAFVKNGLLSTSLELNLSQNVGLTGSQVFVSSSAQRIDYLYNPVPGNPNISYLVNPVAVGVRQPLFGFNQLRWDSRIEPLKFEEAKRAFNEDMEQVSIRASELFFDLLLAQMSVQVQEQNVQNSDTIYKISKGRYNLGKIAENELLQIELNLMNAQNSLSQARMDKDFAMLNLATFLKLPSSQKIDLAEPNVIPDFTVDENIALQEAQANSQRVINFQRQQLEADAEVQKAKRQSRFQGDIYASYGLTNSGNVYQPLYTNPQSQQQVRVGVQVPIINWGRSKASVKTAVSNQELVKITLEQEQQNFKQEVLLLAKQIKIYQEKLYIAGKADTIGDKRFDISYKRYMIGKISVVDLNIANQDKVQSSINYIGALRNFWINYYQLRKKTLYDFQANDKIRYKMK
ncbi:MAG: TolC family protein [Bacteroidia bacterium]